MSHTQHLSQLRKRDNRKGQYGQIKECFPKEYGDWHVIYVQMICFRHPQIGEKLQNRISADTAITKQGIPYTHMS